MSSHLNICLNADSATAAVKEEEVDSTDLLNRRALEKGKSKIKADQGPTDTSTAPKRKRPDVNIAAIVGGMSAQKQRRILDRGVDVLVATPGRLWDILQEVYLPDLNSLLQTSDFTPFAVHQDDQLANQIKGLRFLVLDEADRMIETGHFAELDNILRLTLRENRCV